MEQQIKSEPVANMECFIYLTIGEVVCHETDVEKQLEKGEAFAEQNKTIFDIAMAVAKFYQEQLDLRMNAYARERKALEENKELKHELSKCRASNAFYLDDKRKAVKKAELLEKEVADLKVPESRQNRHLRDELRKVRIECQQAWESANKERTEKEKLQKQLSDLQSAVCDCGDTEDKPIKH